MKDEPNKRDQVTQENQKLSIFDCFRFASFKDSCIFFLGIFLAFINGAANALFGLVTGLALSSLDVRFTEAERNDLALQVTIYYLMIGLCIFIGTIGSRTLLRINAQRQGYKFRKVYLQALLNQEISVFDTLNPTELSSQVENDCRTINEALDSKIETLVWYIGGMICSLVISFARSWQIALMMFVAAPFMLLAIHLYIKTIIKVLTERGTSYARAGAIAEEALANIKTVVSLGGEKVEVQRYQDVLSKAQPTLVKAGIYQGMAFGSTQLIFSGIMAVILFIGSFFIENETINPTTGKPYILADIFTPLNAILLMFSQLPTIGPCLKDLSDAKMKARKILNIVDQAKKNSSELAPKVDNFNGAITFKDVTFAYPINKDKIILQNLDVQIAANSKVAFVGHSGGGKSTIIQLLQKSYEPTRGSIELDGYDSKALDVAWVRKNIAYVSQEPVLFSMTIRDNLLLGKADATEDEIIEALKKVNAYDFVMELENRLDTFIGGGAGSQLSGGQKQRIAIARALLRDAKVLLLDEASSALDRVTEREIQATINSLSRDRTIIIVTHRLSSTQDVDKIFVVDQGRIVEEGKYEQLMQSKGKFFELQTSQSKMEDQTSSEKMSSSLKGTSGFYDDTSSGNWDNEEIPLVGNKSNSNSISKRLIENSGKAEKSSISFMKRVWSLTKPERKNFILGMIGSLGVAITLPAVQWWITEAFASLVDPFNPEFRPHMNLTAILILCTGILAFLFYTMEFGFFTKGSEKLTQYLRVKIFNKFLRMHIGWHDNPNHSAGNLATRLQIDITSVGQITGISLGLIVQIIMTNIITVLIAIAVCWQIGVIGAIIVPVFLFVAVKLNSNEAEGQEKSGEVLSKTEVIISETINNMKTVTSLNAQEKFLTNYGVIIKEYHKIRLRTKLINGFLEGGLFLVLFWDLAAMYYLGNHLYGTLGISQSRIIFAVFVVAITAMTSTQLFVLLPDVGKAIQSIPIVFDYIDMRSKIDIEDKTANYTGKIEGNIEFKNVKFSYPTRRGQVFEDLSFKIDANRHIGITGPSGCGKSTVMQLLLRFYDVDEGEILIDGVNIKQYDLQYLRKKISIVSQEPVLFCESIEYNLKYANQGVSDVEMKEAAEKANALQFIEEGEDGFQRNVGAKGGKLSGGQKQRIAIARALLRKPKILLLDEATSALDIQSENTVQGALNNISKGLTSITVSHRITTLQELEEILMFKDGIIVERGNYGQLLQKHGHFYQLKEALSQK